MSRSNVLRPRCGGLFGEDRAVLAGPGQLGLLRCGVDRHGHADYRQFVFGQRKAHLEHRLRIGKYRRRTQGVGVDKRLAAQMRLAFGGHDLSSFAKIGRALNGAGPYAAQFKLSGRYL
jgi:hypothetical protein